MIDAGDRDRLITIEREIKKDVNAVNEAVTAWDPLCKAWAKVFWGKGSERREAAQKTGKISATFNILSSTESRSVTPRDRIRFEDAVWDITGVSPVERTEIEITAVRRTT